MKLKRLIAISSALTLTDTAIPHYRFPEPVHMFHVLTIKFILGERNNPLNLKLEDIVDWSGEYAVSLLIGQTLFDVIQEQVQ